MDTSILIAKLMGPVMIASSASLLVNRDIVHDLIENIADSPALLFMAGVMALVMGLLIVNFHNLWVEDWRVLITIYGWIAVVAGVLRMVFPRLVIDMASGIVGNRWFIGVVAILNVLLGCALTYLGYFA